MSRANVWKGLGFLVVVFSAVVFSSFALAADTNTPPFPPEDSLGPTPPVLSLYAAPTSTPVVSVTYLEYDSQRIQALDNQLVAMQEAGEDVSDARDLIQAGKDLKEQGLQREADAVFRQAEALLTSARATADRDFGNRLAIAAFICLILLALLYLPWQEKIDSFRERLHGPLQNKRDVLVRKKSGR